MNSNNKTPTQLLSDWPDQSLQESTVVRGVMRSETSLFFNAQLEGTLVHATQVHDSDSVLVIGPKARVRGKILAKHVIVHGYVEGDILASEFLHISSMGFVTGNVTARKIRVDYGGVIQGMSKSNATQVDELITQELSRM